MGPLSPVLLKLDSCTLSSHSKCPVPSHKAKPPNILLVCETFVPLTVIEIYFTFFTFVHTVPNITHVSLTV